MEFLAVEGEKKKKECNVIMMSTLPGRERSLGHRMYSKYRVRLLRDVQTYMARMNEARASSAETVCNPTSGGAISDLDGLRCLKFPLLDGFIDGTVDLSLFVDEMCWNTSQTSSMIPLQRSVLHQPTGLFHRDSSPHPILSYGLPSGQHLD